MTSSLLTSAENFEEYESREFLSWGRVKYRSRLRITSIGHFGGEGCQRKRIRGDRNLFSTCYIYKRQ